jgi:hypothetical protein
VMRKCPGRWRAQRSLICSEGWLAGWAVELACWVRFGWLAGCGWAGHQAHRSGCVGAVSGASRDLAATTVLLQ